MQAVKILITEKIDSILFDMLTAAGFNCTHIEEISYAQLSGIIANYNGLIVRSKVTIDAALIDKGINLSCIGRAGSGMELIDTQYAQQKGITCYNSPEGNKDAVAEQAVGMLMALLHHTCTADAEMRQAQWNRLSHRGNELMGSTVGIIGFGNTGSAFAQRLQGFGVNILAYDKYQTNYGNAYTQVATMASIFEEADVISLHLPLNTETQHLVDAHFIGQFKKPIYLINTSRGGIVNTNDILTALQQKQLKGLALDVFENEDFSSYNANEWATYKQLAQQKNCVLSPHTGGLSVQSAHKIAAVLGKKIIQHFNTKI
jgi:D-3-phosphoglycerate dehydrogenase